MKLGELATVFLGNLIDLDLEVLIAVSCFIGSTISHGCFSILGEARLDFGLR